MQSNICKNLPQQPANVQQPTTSEFVKGSPSMNDLKGKKKKNKKNSMMGLNHRGSVDNDNKILVVTGQKTFTRPLV